MLILGDSFVAAKALEVGSRVKRVQGLLNCSFELYGAFSPLSLVAWCLKGR